MIRTLKAIFCTLLVAMAARAEVGYRRGETWSETMAAMREALPADVADAGPVRDLPFEPYDSGPIAGNGPAKHVVVDITGLDVLRLVATCEKHPANCNIWGEPKLIAEDGSITRLTDLTPTAIKVGWGEMLLHKNWQNHPLIVGDRTFEFGFWVHADSELTFELSGRYVRFEAHVGEDKDRAAGTVRFRVLAAARPLPDAWADIRADFPTQASWFSQDAGNDGVATWFDTRTTAALERALLERALGGLPAESALQRQFRELVAAEPAPGDARWLELYAQARRLQVCRSALAGIQAGPNRDRLAAALAALEDAAPAAHDPRWDAFRREVMLARERDDQFTSLEHDIRQQAAWAKAKGTRRWNGTTYTPAEGSIAGEIAAQTFVRAALIQNRDRDPADIVARRTRALLTDLKRLSPAKAAPFEAPLETLAERVAGTPPEDKSARRALHHDLAGLRRRIALANPLLDFDDIVFIKRHRSFYNHMCDQFYGICQNPGGGLYVLENAFGDQPTVRSVLARARCETGRLAGQRLDGGSGAPAKLRYDGSRRISGQDVPGGSFLSPALSPDGRTLCFAYVEREGSPEQAFHEDPSRGHWDEKRCYHIFSVNLDGTGLKQLTDGTWNDFDPCWLPNGKIAFISERRGGYLRCGRACPLYTLYSMNPDGSAINCLSFHDSNEWNPSVTHDGRIVWTRWDYVDRHGCVAHMPWITTLDGRDPRPLHGNYAPRQARPDMELYVRAIPNSRKYVGLAAPHHGQSYGSLIVINPQVPDDDGMGPVRRLTPEVGFPESQGGRQVYSTPWPLSETYHLCVYDAAMNGVNLGRPGGRYGIYLIDAFGNRELIYRDPNIGCMNPIPLRPTKLPPAPASDLAERHEDRGVTIGDEGEGTMAVLNVYDHQTGWPEGTAIHALRVFQLLPCAVPSGGMRPHETGKRIAEAGDSVVPCRWVLGTTPVEADGSAHFKVPAYRELFFQALDKQGRAVTSMRSATHVRDGELLVCAGCHENKAKATPRPERLPLALRRPAAPLTPDVEGSNPFSYPQLVQPVLDRNCVECHTRNRGKKAPNLARDPIAGKFYASYHSLVKLGFTRYGDVYRTRTGQFGARASRLIQMLDKGHHDLELPPEDMHRLSLWADSCSMFYGVFERGPGEAQLRGETARAILE